MSQKSTRKSVRFNETPLVRQYSNDYSADRKKNSQTQEELNRARRDKNLEITITANSQGKTPINTDVIQITRQPTLSDQRLQYLSSVTTPNFKNKGKWHKVKKTFKGLFERGGRRGTRKKRSRRTRKNRYY
jgi:hypothetical protein